ncbi:MAG: glucose-1-phosphate cytidylyltransferase [Polyangiaceae bacterium]|nr:glucose-1-phosphate cytidylyltransferase [Polyangiaceae bacterium]
MKVVILCGGMGTRLREETEFKPKPMVEIGGRPILWHIMKIYAYHGYRDFVLCLGYRGEAIKEYFLNYEAMNNDFTISLGRRHLIEYHDAHAEQDFRVTLADTGQTAMTGARVKRVERYLEGDTFMVTYGDGVSNIDVSQLVAFHRSHGKLATISTMWPASRFGIVETDATGTVTSFVEKPKMQGRASAGFFVFDRRVLGYLSDDEDCVLEREPLEHLARDGQLVSYPHDGFFFAMDTYREYQRLSELWATGEAPWKVWP